MSANSLRSTGLFVDLFVATIFFFGSSSKLLQHLFTHIFFCHHCTFYSFSQHNLYQHIHENHPTYAKNDNIDPKQLELLYITRCADGTFALCMDSSSSSSSSSMAASFPRPTNNKSPIPLNHKVIKPKAVKTKPIKEKAPPKPPKEKRSTKDIVIISEKSDPQPSKSSITTNRQDSSKENQANTYVLMRHRRCFLARHSASLHSTTLEYNICREHTIRHMCQTPATIKRRKLPSVSRQGHLIDEVAICLKSMVNQLVDNEESR